MTFTCETDDTILPNEVIDIDEANRVLGTPVRKPKFAKAMHGLCRWTPCSAPLRGTGRRSLATYCCDQCRINHHNYVKKQGALIVTAAKNWRRYKSKGSFSLFTKLVDSLIEDDKMQDITEYDVNPPAWIHATRIKAMKKLES